MIILAVANQVIIIMKHLFSVITFVVLGICLVSCSKTNVSASLSGTEWSQTVGSKSTVDLSFSSLEFSLVYTVREKTENAIPGDGYRIKGSYVYESPEAMLYGRTIEYMFNGEVEGVNTYKEEFKAVIVDNILSLYHGDEVLGSFSRKK